MSAVTQYNFLERLLSSDLNNAQLVSNREWEEVFRYLGARRRSPSLYSPINGSGAEAIPDAFCCGLEVTRLNATTVRVARGVLFLDQPGNITQGALDSAFRIGRHRNFTDVTMPVSAYVSGAFFLLSARLVREETLVQQLEIFDIPTQTFLLQMLPKHVEHTLEFRWDDPGAPGFAQWKDLPAGEGWEPLAYVNLWQDPSSVMHGQVLDVRRDLRDVIRAQDEDQVSNTLLAGSPAWVLERSIESCAVPTQLTSNPGIRGSFWASRAGTLMGFDRPLDVGGDQTEHSFTPLEAPVAGGLTHFWLIPGVSGGKTRVPSGTLTYVGGSPLLPQRLRGFLVSTETLVPTRAGFNAAQITMPGFDPVEVGQAVHVCSARKDAANFNFDPFTLTGKRHRYSNPRVVVFGAGTVFPVTAATFDLRGKVPPNVKSVILQCRLVIDGSAATGTAWFRFNKGSGVLAETSCAVGSALADGFAANEVEVPVFTPHADDPTDTTKDGYLLMGLDVGGALGGTLADWIYQVALVGWEYA